MAICFTETSAGMVKIGDISKNPNIYEASLGIMQLRLETVRHMGERLQLEYVNKLLADDKFNIKIATLLVVWMNDRFGGDYFKTVSRYNGGNKNIKYYKKVVSNMKKIDILFNLKKRKEKNKDLKLFLKKKLKKV